MAIQQQMQGKQPGQQIVIQTQQPATTQSAETTTASTVDQSQFSTTTQVSIKSLNNAIFFITTCFPEKSIQSFLIMISTVILFF